MAPLRAAVVKATINGRFIGFSSSAGVAGYFVAGAKMMFQSVSGRPYEELGPEVYWTLVQ
jgi:hypothetical protein